MKVHRAKLIRALEIALGLADLKHSKAPDVSFSRTAGGILVRGQTEEGSGWDIVPASKQLSGAFVVPGRPILQTLKEIRAHSIDLVCGADELQVVAGGYRAVFWTRPLEDVPVQEDHGQRWMTDKNIVGILGMMIAYARPKGRNKSIFPGIHLLLGPGGLRMVATDGRRLALAEEVTFSAASESTELILPGRFLLLASRYLKRDAPTAMVLGKGSFSLRQEARGVEAVALEGPMPSYDALVPGKTRHKGWFRRQRVIEAIRQARLFSPRVKMVIDDCKLYLSTPETPEGMAQIVVGIEWTGPLYQAQHNTDELLEALENLSGEEIAVEVQNEKVPLVLHGDNSSLATLMPLLW